MSEPRPKVPTPIETAVLTKSARRCCLCCGLNGDLEEKAGQIAHLDGDRTNNKEENLAWLCFVHHDEYDSTTSQRKNYTIHEVKHYRDQLHAKVKEGIDTYRAPGAVPHKSIRDVVSLCRRRAIFTETDYENSTQAMFTSINNCRASLQQITDYVEPPSVRPTVDSLVSRLHAIGGMEDAYRSDRSKEKSVSREIDRIKLQILETLLQLARLSGEDFRIPHRLIRGHYYHNVNDAEKPPTEIYY